MESKKVCGVTFSPDNQWMGVSYSDGDLRMIPIEDDQPESPNAAQKPEKVKKRGWTSMGNFWLRAIIGIAIVAVVSTAAWNGVFFVVLTALGRPEMLFTEMVQMVTTVLVIGTAFLGGMWLFDVL